MTNTNLPSNEGINKDASYKSGHVPTPAESKEGVSSGTFTGAKEATPKEAAPKEVTPKNEK